MDSKWCPGSSLNICTVLQGVVKQLTNYWFSNSTFISLRDRKLVSIKLQNIKPPRQVQRLSRPIEEKSYWKAREWENWLLFYSVVILRGILKKVYLDHWFLLAEAMHILLSDKITISMLEKAEMLLCEFVCKTQLFYGESAMTFNMHLLTHLKECVFNWGPLWATSAFPFESSNAQLLRLIKNSNGSHFKFVETCLFGMQHI